MATRPTVRTQNTECRPCNVHTSSTVRKGFPVKYSAGTTNVIEATANTDNCVGVSRDAGDAAGTSGLKQIGVYKHGGCVPMLVGTGGVTAGNPVRLAAAADGVTDATVGGGTTKILVIGVAEDTGVAGDYVGVNLNPNFTAGS
jgi:hypothetical protein